MNVRRRSGLMGGAVGSAPKNAATERRDAVSQVKKIKGSVSTPRATGPSKVRNAVNGPRQ
jgi:hypothetical protein